MMESLTSASWEVTIREMVVGSVDRSVILTAWKLIVARRRGIGRKECHHRYWS